MLHYVEGDVMYYKSSAGGTRKPISKLHYDWLVLKGKVHLWICLKALTAEWKAGVSLTWSKQCVKWWAKPLFHVLWSK